MQIHPNSILVGPFEPLRLHEFLEFCEREGNAYSRNIKMNGIGVKDQGLIKRFRIGMKRKQLPER